MDTIDIGYVALRIMILATVISSIIAVQGTAAQSTPGIPKLSLLCIVPRPYAHINESLVVYIINSMANPGPCQSYGYRIDLNDSKIIALVNVSNTTGGITTENLTINYTSDTGTVKVPQFNYTYTINFNQVREMVMCDDTSSLQFFNLSLLEQLIANLINYLSGNNFRACEYKILA